MFRNKEFYEYEAYKKLIQNKIDIQLSRLYRILKEMQEKAILDFRWEENPSGPRKKRIISSFSFSNHPCVPRGVQ